MKSIYKDWDEIIKMPSQKEKLDKSFSKEYTPYYISKESFAATFGNDTKTIVCYLTKHNCCNCDEYQRKEDGKNYPCSHVYRLAYELGLINKEGEVISKLKNGGITEQEKDNIFIDIINTIESNLTYDQQITIVQSKIIDKISECVFSPTHTPFRKKKCVASQLSNLGLLEICNDSNIGLIYYHGLISGIISNLDRNGFEWDDSLPKTQSGSIQIKAKRDWCLAHPDETVKNAFSIEDEYIMVRPSKELCCVWDLVLKYLERKFFDTEIKDKFYEHKIKHPSGAIITDHIDKEYEFPQDTITKLLTQNGYNRCITKEKGICVGSIKPHLLKSSTDKNKFSFTIKIPQESDFDVFIEHLEVLGDFYEIPKDTLTINDFVNVINHLKELDVLLNKTVEDNFLAIKVVRSLITKHIKEELEIKKDFKTIKVQLNNGEIIEGYTKIVSELNKGNHIASIIKCSNNV